MAQVRHSRFGILFVGAGLLAGLTGCGTGGKSDVSGTIKVRGQLPRFSGLQVVFLHVDCDLYSATKTIFEQLGPMLFGFACAVHTA